VAAQRANPVIPQLERLAGDLDELPSVVAEPADLIEAARIYLVLQVESATKHAVTRQWTKEAISVMYDSPFAVALYPKLDGQTGVEASLPAEVQKEFPVLTRNIVTRLPLSIAKSAPAVLDKENDQEGQAEKERHNHPAQNRPCNANPALVDERHKEAAYTSDKNDGQAQRYPPAEPAVRAPGGTPDLTSQ
jgi:hypothetical protein